MTKPVLPAHLSIFQMMRMIGMMPHLTVTRTCLALCPDLLKVGAFKALTTWQGPYSYKYILSTAGDDLQMVVVGADHVRSNPGEYLVHVEGVEEDDFVGHCSAVKVMDGTVYIITPSASGRPLLKPGAVGGGKYIQLFGKGRGVPCDLTHPLLGSIAGGER